MPEKFKALTSITAWAMWIIAWGIGLSTLAKGLMTRDLYGFNTEPTPMIYPIFFTVALAYLFLSVVVMRIRQKMEED